MLLKIIFIRCLVNLFSIYKYIFSASKKHPHKTKKSSYPITTQIGKVTSVFEKSCQFEQLPSQSLMRVTGFLTPTENHVQQHQSMPVYNQFRLFSIEFKTLHPFHIRTHDSSCITFMQLPLFPPIKYLDHIKQKHKFFMLRCENLS